MTPRKPLAAKLPWNDKAGRLSPLKAATFVLLFLPALWLSYRALFLGLGARPLTEAIHKLGDWTIYFVLLSLAITPARRLFNWSKLIQVRRMIGLSALFYILCHLLLYTVDSRLDLGFVFREIVWRIYLTIGIVAILGLVALGVTSTDAMIRRMGAREWNTLHNLIYPIGGLALLHYFMQAKADVTQPVLMSGFFLWLMGYRAMARLGFKEGWVPLAILSVVAALLTAAVEFCWYAFMTSIGVANASRVLMANLDFSYQVRPMWWVLLIGLAVTAVAEVRRHMGHAPRRGRAPAAA